MTKLESRDALQLHWAITMRRMKQFQSTMEKRGHSQLQLPLQNLMDCMMNLNVEVVRALGNLAPDEIEYAEVKNNLVRGIPFPQGATLA